MWIVWRGLSLAPFPILRQQCLSIPARRERLQLRQDRVTRFVQCARRNRRVRERSCALGLALQDRLAITPRRRLAQRKL